MTYPGCPGYVPVAACDAKSVLVCVGVDRSYLRWTKIALSDLPDYLAGLDNLERVVVDEVAGASV